MSYDERHLSIEDLLGRPLSDLELRYSPDKVYTRGQMSIPLIDPKVSIIGSRNATDDGIRNAQLVTKFLVKQNIIVVSGLADGIDATAHKTTIDNGGKTIAVLGTPLNKTYPSKNNQLQQQIMNEHLAVSQYPTGHPITRQNFIIRNKTMALISDAVIIIEAQDNSGTRHQAWEAIRLRRPLFIWESIFNDERLKLPHKLLTYGAMKLSNPEDILKYIPSKLIQV